MKQLPFLTLALLTLILTACSPDSISSEKDAHILSELAGVIHMVDVPTSQYERIEIKDLIRPDEDSPYSEGIIEYRENGQQVARVEFGTSGTNMASYVGQGTTKEIALKKEGKDKEEAYTKVIIEPLVQASDCSYISAGIIKFYDIKTGDWVATFDYGDGSCDEFILKTNKDGNHTFSMNDYPEWK